MVIAVILGLTLYIIIAYNLVVGSNRLSLQLWRFFLWTGLCVFLYRGANWARWVASVLFILNGGLLFTFSAAVPNRLEMVWTGWVFIVSGAVLLFVPSVRLYFRTRGPSAP